MDASPGTFDLAAPSTAANAARHRPAPARRRALARRAVLFVGGTLNQTTMMHQVAAELGEHDCFFTPFYADGLMRRLADAGFLDFTILAGQARRRTEAYFAQHGLPVDRRGAAREYDLVVTGTDLIVPRNLRGRPMVLVQEGMTEPETALYRAVRALGLPRFLADTAATGLSHAYSAFCVASDGYRELFVRKGVDPRRIVVTGIPNFDNAAAYLDNSFPHRGHVLVATSCQREIMRYEDRRAFIRRALAVADGRPLIFKLHPNERAARATREIEALAPGAMVFADGSINEMIANCDAFVTRRSTSVYVALALGKEVHAELDLATLRRLLPIQNGGTSARRIAEVCRQQLG